MKLTGTTDYALRSVLYMAALDKCVNSQEISDRMGIPRKYLIKLLTNLRGADIVRSYGGVKGGYALSRPPEEIALHDVIAAIEKSCDAIDFSGEGFEDSEILSRLQKAYGYMQSEWDIFTKKITIATLLEQFGTDGLGAG